MSEEHAHPQVTNRLIHELSPYLLQHAHNPVEWYPWGPEALEKARREDKPILLSIGYSACHWCHVMAHESFEDEEIARIMNERFVNIKVDREERPDLDEIYMNAIQILSGHGGWPLNVFLTPDLEPFYGGTYFPPSDRGGMPGFPRVIERVSEFYRTRNREIRQHVAELVDQLKALSAIPAPPGEPAEPLLSRAIQELHRSFDPVHGGFGGAPKFPHAMGLQLLLRHWARTQDPTSRHVVTFSLDRMARGGMYDQLGGGFHRYSVDERWLVPHFEKMLYDNALLAPAYLEAYQVTRTPFFRQVTEEILEYVLREMTSPEGGFYSTTDADTDGEEGQFFAWTPEEIAAVAGEREGQVLCRYFGVTPHGNFEHGASVLHLPMAVDAVAELEKLPVHEVERIVLEGKAKLFVTRATRIPPGRDEKILTGWNGLMLSAFSLAAMVLENPHYLEAAGRNAKFLKGHLIVDRVLHHLEKEGQVRQPAFLDDFAFLLNGLLDLFAASAEAAWLEWALELAEAMHAEFQDAAGGGYFYTGTRHEALIARSKSPYDTAIPSGNSVAALALLRLARLTGNEEYRERAMGILRAFHPLMERTPGAFSQMLIATDYLLFPGPEVVISGPKDGRETRECLRVLGESFQPNRIQAVRDPAEPPDALMPWVADKGMRGGRVTVYCCRGDVCQAPVTDAGRLAELLT